jgi:glycosyltransferase involved in cell wall biosynthesis
MSLKSITMVSNQLKIWLIQPGEEMEFDTGSPRMLRTGILANALVDRGHSVTYWNSTFNHQQKKQRCSSTEVRQLRKNYEVILLAGKSYKKNISLARIYSQIETANAFRKLSPSRERPDLILVCLPTIELAEQAVKFAKKMSIPVIVDCRDMWPDIFLDSISSLKGLLARPLIKFWQLKRNYVMRNATAITGVTENYVTWGLECGKRQQSKFDRPFHLAIDPSTLNASEMDEADQFWQNRLAPLSKATRIFVYGGTLSSRNDVGLIAKAFDQASKTTDADIRLVICGKGDTEVELEKFALNNDRILLAGWRNGAQLKSLYKKACVGILPYPNDAGFLNNYPNKVGEYLSHGFLIMTGLKGVTGKLLLDNNVCLTYEFGNLESATRAILQVAESKIDLTNSAIRSRQIFESEFNPTKIYPEFCDYIELIANSATMS